MVSQVQRLHPRHHWNRIWQNCCRSCRWQHCCAQSECLCGYSDLLDFSMMVYSMWMGQVGMMIHGTSILAPALLLPWSSAMRRLCGVVLERPSWLSIPSKYCSCDITMTSFVVFCCLQYIGANPLAASEWQGEQDALWGPWRMDFL